MTDPTPPAVSPVDTAALRDEIRRTIGGDFHARLIAADLLDDDDVLSVLRVFEDVVPVIAEREAALSASAHREGQARRTLVEDGGLPMLAGLLADLDRAETERDKLGREVDRLHAELADARPIPDDAAERLADKLRDLGVVDPDDGTMPVFVATEDSQSDPGGCIDHWVNVEGIAEELVQHLGATRTTGPVPAAADGEVRALLVHPAAWDRLVDWLTSRGLTVGGAGDLEGIPTYFMGISDELARVTGVTPTIPPDTRRDAMFARRAELLAAHPEITAAAELAPLMGDLAQEYWDWCIERHLDGATEAVNGDV